MSTDSTLTGIVIFAAVLLTSIVVVVGVVAIFWLMLRKSARFFRTIAAMPIVPVSQAKDGSLVKIRGAVRFADEVLSDPLLGEPCAAYKVSVTVDRGHHGHGDRFARRFAVIAADSQSVDFLVDDGTAVARVTGPVNIFSPTFTAAADSPRVAELLRARGTPPPDGPLYPTGRALRAGAMLLIAGTARRVAGTSPYRGRPVEVVIEPFGRFPVAIADTDEAFIGKKAEADR